MKVWLCFLLGGFLLNPSALRATSETARSPDLVLLLTGDTRGFLEDCGCRGSTEGGVARRAFVIKELRKRFPGKVLVLDAGRIVYGDEPVDQHRTRVYIDLMKQMGYDIVNVGVTDLAYGPSFLVKAFRPDGATLLSSNLRGGDFECKPYVLKKVGNRRIALLGLTEPAGLTTTGLTVASPARALRQVLSTIDGKADFIVVISDLSHDHNREIIGQFRKHIDLLLGSLEGRASEVIMGIPIVRSARYGRDLRRVDVFFHSQGEASSIKVGSISLSREVPEDTEIRASLIRFYRSFESNPETEGFGKILFADRHIEQLKGNGFVGARVCCSCHKEQYLSWVRTPHARAYSALLPSQRNFLPRCLVCHTTGYGYESGYRPGRDNPGSPKCSMRDLPWARVVT